MAQRRHHYERAFEEYLRSRRVPYVSVADARKALLPDSATLRRPVDQPRREHDPLQPPSSHADAPSLKSFDFMVYGEGTNLILDIKGRRVGKRGGHADGKPRGVSSRLESWVTEDDLDSLAQWERLFGHGFAAGFVFVYWCDEQPPDALFQEIFEYRGRWYALRALSLQLYREVMKPRSKRWRTVDIPTGLFAQVSQPFAPPLRRTQARYDTSGRVVFGIEDGIGVTAWSRTARHAQSADHQPAELQHGRQPVHSQGSLRESAPQ